MDSRSNLYAWRSIPKGRDALQRGARWRVRNGESIKIWQHFWFPRKHPPQVVSYPIKSMENSTMATLIDENTRQWNEGLIDGIFCQDICESLLGTYVNIELANPLTKSSLFVIRQIQDVFNASTNKVSSSSVKAMQVCPRNK